MPKETCHGHSPNSALTPPTIRATRFFHKYLCEFPYLSDLLYDVTFSQGRIPHGTDFLIGSCPDPVENHVMIMFYMYRKLVLSISIQTEIYVSVYLRRSKR